MFFSNFTSPEHFYVAARHATSATTGTADIRKSLQTRVQQQLP
jgi:hypothetical protein